MQHVLPTGPVFPQKMALTMSGTLGTYWEKLTIGKIGQGGAGGGNADWLRTGGSQERRQKWGGGLATACSVSALFGVALMAGCSQSLGQNAAEMH